MLTRSHLLGLSLLVAIGGSPAFADITYSSTASGQNGTAVFSASGQTFTVKLTNNNTTFGSVANVLDGFEFTLVGGSGVTLTSVSASGFVDCKVGPDCHSVLTFHDYGANADLSSPYGWLYSTPKLAPQGYKPAGIVSTDILGTSTASIPNAEHNDYLMGPVTFTFSFTGTITNVSSATFLWGTTPDRSTGTRTCTDCVITPTGSPVPEPTSIVLLGGVLLGVAAISRRKARNV